MFTGIVSMGTVHAIEHGDGSARLVIDAGPLADDAEIGDSVATNGCCLTVVAREGPLLSFDCITETLDLTSLGQLAPGDRINLELSLRSADRLGGHFVTGHVDGTGTIERLETEPGQTLLEVGCARSLTDQLVTKGSVALDGVSLTITAVADGRISVALIPHTLEVTNLGTAKVGDRINIETDLLGKYVQRFLEGKRDAE